MDASGGRHRPERALVGVSLAQLACGLTGAQVAVRRGHAYDVGFMRGTPERVARDALLTGTALSAPGPMLVTQAVLTAVVARRSSQRAATGLRLLGGLMTSGYLAERLVRHRLRPRGWDPVESPLVAAGLLLAVGLMLLGRRPAPGRQRARQAS